MSDINTNGIDKDYPRPGEDNDSIGFRNNFSEIKNNLDTAKNELEDLQDNAVRTDQDNDLNGQKITDAVFSSTTQQVYPVGNSTENLRLDFSNGSFQTVTIVDDVSITLEGWPDEDRMAKMQVLLYSDGPTRSVTWFVEESGSLKTNEGIPVQLYDSTDGSNITVGGWPTDFEVDSNENPILVEFFSFDGGDTVFGRYLGKFV